MSKQKEWQRFTELRDNGVPKPDGIELFMYQHGLHVFAIGMLLLVAYLHARMVKERKRREERAKAFDAVFSMDKDGFGLD